MLSAFSLRKLSVAAATSTSRLSASRWASTLVVSEPLVGGVTPPGTQSSVTAATQLGQPVELLVVGDEAPTKIPTGVQKVYHVAIGDKLPETVANAVQATVSSDTTVVLGTSSKYGSTVIPRIAAQLKASPITDILEIQDESEYYYSSIKCIFCCNLILTCARLFLFIGPFPLLC